MLSELEVEALPPASIQNAAAVGMPWTAIARSSRAGARGPGWFHPPTGVSQGAFAASGRSAHGPARATTSTKSERRRAALPQACGVGGEASNVRVCGASELL
jgi:hypothetical protein